jgi:hypothetical protein
MSLVELLVGVAIGLVMVLAGSAVYLYSKRSFNYATESSQVEENGRYAANLLSKYIQSAGFVMIDMQPQIPIVQKISGCEYGMANVNETTSTTPTAYADLACRLTAQAGLARQSGSIYVDFETDQPNSIGTNFQGLDCLGGPAVTLTDATTGRVSYHVRAYFFVSAITVQTASGPVTSRQLSCVADRSPSAAAPSFASGALFPGIEQIVFNFVQPSTADSTVAQISKANYPSRTPASGGTPITGTTLAEFNTALAVEMCVMSKSTQTGSNDTSTSTQYRDCYGDNITATAGEVYRTIRTTVRLRNTTSIS